MISSTGWVVVLSGLIGGVLSHNIKLGAHSRECFHEMLHRDDKMTVTFQVGDREFGGAGNLDVDFWVCSFLRVLQQWSSCLAFWRTLIRSIRLPSFVEVITPGNADSCAFALHRSKTPTMPTKSTNAVSRLATTPSMPNTTANTSTASATTIGALRPRKSRLMSMASSMCRRRRYLPILWKQKVCLLGPFCAWIWRYWEVAWGLRCGANDCVGAIVKQLSELLSQVKDEQSYIIVRERTHRNTAESTNARVKWWSIFQLGVLIGEGIFQVWWLKRFFEVSSSPWLMHYHGYTADWVR